MGTTNYTEMSRADLAKAFNEMAQQALAKNIKGFTIIKAFKDKAIGVARCKKIEEALASRTEPVRAPAKPKPLPKELTLSQQMMVADGCPAEIVGLTAEERKAAWAEHKPTVIVSAASEASSALAEAVRKGRVPKSALTDPKTASELMAPVVAAQKVGKAAKGLRAKASADGAPRWTIRASRELWNSLVPMAKKAGMKDVAVQTSWSSHKQAAIRLAYLRDGLKKAGVQIPEQLVKALSALR